MSNIGFFQFSLDCCLFVELVIRLHEQVLVDVVWPIQEVFFIIDGAFQ